MTIEFSISDWSGWVRQNPAVTPVASSRITRSQSPNVTNIPAMLRRRLNLPGRAAADQTMGLLAGNNDATIVYCSRHGDIERTLGVLEDIAADNPVSPMNFSLAIHNAIPGVISIHGGITAGISSIAFGEESLMPTLLEAAGLLSKECRRVVCIISDVFLPDIFPARDFYPEESFAICFIITANEGLALTLEYDGIAMPDTTSAKIEPSPILFAEFLEARAHSMFTYHNGGRWRLCKQ